MKPLTQPMKVTLVAGSFGLVAVLLLFVLGVFATIFIPGRYVIVPGNGIGPSSYIAVLDRFSGRVRYCMPTRGCQDMAEPPGGTPPALTPRSF